MIHAPDIPARKADTRKADKPVVLIVDDVPECVEMLGVILEDEYTVRVATSGRRALQLAQQHPLPDLVLLDVLMPDMDGHEVLAVLRNDERTRHIPAIFVTSLHDANDELACLEQGAADFIVKPASPAIVQARVRSQIELKRTRDRLAEHNRALTAEVRARRAAESQLQSTVEDLRAFSYSLSHDLRAPLTAIGAFAGLLREDKDMPPSAMHRLERILHGTTRMNAMIDDILACARADHIDLNIQNVDLNALVAQVVAELSPAWPDTATTLGPLPVVRGDPVWLRQVILNLMGNAFKFSGGRSDAHVEVRARATPAGQEISVTDNGAGFEPGMAAGLFTLFHRLHAESEFPGTGVGLSIVKRIVTRHGGTVRAQSEPGVATTFAFTLP